MVRGFWAVLVIGLWGAVGCGDDDDDDVIVFPDAGITDAAPDATPGDDNDSIDDAVPVDIGDPGRSGTIGFPGDQDFFVFEGSEGQWLEISALPDDFTSELFPIVTLLDSGGRQLAEGYVLVTRLPSSATYYVKVEDFTSLFGDPMPFYDPNDPYTFDIVEIIDGVDDYYFDTETGDDAGSARSVPLSSFFFIDLLGGYDHAGDRDVFSLTLDGSATTWMASFVGAPGPNGNGSTSDYGALWITDATGSEILARIDNTAFALNPPLPSPATYLLWIEKDAAAPGDNDFYEIALFGGFEDDPPEKETLAMPGTNDTIALADANGELVPLGSDTTYFIAYLPEGDVDYIGFDATAAVSIESYCTAASSGSGLDGMTAEIRDSSDTTLTSGTEPAPVFLDTTLPAPGRYYFRLSASGQDPEVTGNWVRCNISVPSL